MQTETRHRPRAAVLASLLLAAAWVAAPAAAQETHRCAAVADPGKRLACYDQAFPLPPQVEAEVAKAAVEGFGLPSAASPVDLPDPERIESRVAKLVYDGSGRRSITLENGQVWRLADATDKGHMTVGEPVSVHKGLLGSYLLTTDGGVTLRVRRSR